MFGRRKRETVASVDDSSWTVATTSYDGHPLMLRVNAAYQSASDLADYPIRMGVALPLNDPDDRGWPRANGDEGRQLQDAEDAILAALRNRAVLVLVITGKDMREFVFHSRDGDWIGEFHAQANEAVRTHVVQVMAETDPKWTVYRRYLPVP